MKKIILIIIVCCLFGCTNESGTRNLLENSGYTDIEITGYSMFGCSEDDTYQT